jgi:hypothetical protein
MPTGTQSTTARRLHYQQVSYLRMALNYNDANIANGSPKQWLPAGALIVGTDTYVGTAFNAGSTNVVSIGTNGPSTYNNIAAPTVTATGLTQNTPPTGTALGPLAADAQVFAKYAQTGGAATAGSCIIVVKYIVNNDM